MKEQPTRRFGPSYDSRSIKASILLTRISMIALVLTLAATAACATQQHERACAGQILADKIIELRNYTLLPSRRDTLISLFEREFIETQEAVGARIVGTFRDLNAPDHFVWIRSFKDLDTRALALTAFYNGPAWHAHSKAANATMIDTDNVHMLHSVGAPLRMPSAPPALDAPGTSQSLIVIDVYALRGHTEEELRALAIRDPAIIAMFSTEGNPNNFPALPVRSDSVFATIRRFDAKRETIPRIQQLPEPEQTLRLGPTVAIAVAVMGLGMAPTKSCGIVVHAPASKWRSSRGTGNDQHGHPPRKFLECAIAEVERSRSPQPDKE